MLATRRAEATSRRGRAARYGLGCCRLRGRLRGEKPAALAVDASPLPQIADVGQRAEDEVAVGTVIEGRMEIAEVAAAIAEREFTNALLHVLPLGGSEEAYDVPVELDALSDLVIAGVQKIPVG